MSRTTSSLQAEYRERFGGNDKPLLVRSPGRVNIIGEHTDYNEGFVLPAAIDKSTYVALAKRSDDRIQLYASAFQQQHETDLHELQRSEKRWPDYVLGIVDQLRRNGHSLGGFHLLLDGDIPPGAGLSSSAALECATVFALNEVFNLGMSRMEMAFLAQKSEHEFVGVKCGIMDMFASLFGKKDHVILLDCRDQHYDYLPLDLGAYKLLLLNTNVKHNLSSSEYNTRRLQCEQGVDCVRQHKPGIQSLRDVTRDMLDEWVLPEDRLIYQRCRYVVEENARLQEAHHDLRKGDLTALGRKMFATHEGLSRLYEVSCPELDFLVEYVKNNPAVLGARMMGGGFGGCAINIVHESAIEQLVAQIKPAYELASNLSLDYYVASIEDGTQLMS